MLFSELAPFVRFAQIIHYRSAGAHVYVRDCRIFYILSGHGQIRMGEQVYSVEPHTVIYCSAGSEYSISSPGMELISVNFDLTQDYCDSGQPYPPIVLPTKTPLPPANRSSVADQSILDKHILLANGIAFRELMETILEECSAKRSLYRENAGALLKQLLVGLLRDRVNNASRGAQVVEKVIEHIRAHYSQPVTGAQLSRRFGYHEYYLNRLFLKHTGSTIHQYLLDVRIGSAKKLLINTDLPLGVIAEQTGFNSNTYFSSYFRKFTGVSPAQFRKNGKNAI